MKHDGKRAKAEPDARRTRRALYIDRNQPEREPMKVPDCTFTHLHVHTEYSLLDGISNIPKLVARTGELGMDTLAITDHGAMYGAVDFYSECKEQGIKPIIGCEIYVTDRPLDERVSTTRERTFHATILCQNNEGYANLVKLVTKAHLEGFYYRPRVSMESLAERSRGLVMLSGCPSGQLQRTLGPDGDLKEAERIIRTHRDIFGDRYWLEIQRHRDVPTLETINKQMVHLSKKTGVPLVATNDSHYTNAEDAASHNLFMAMQTQDRLDNEERLTLEDASYYVKSATEMTGLFPDLPEALDNAVLIGQDCKVELDFGRKRLPTFPRPEGMSSDQYLEQLCRKGFARKCPQHDEVYAKRLDYELEVVRETQFADYFLIVWDIIKFARENGIQLTVRGSAAASLVLYCLDITPADPIRYSLVFERFLNLERREMPDVDMDFQDNRRDEVIRYVVDRYGEDRVAQIGTFNRYGVKSVLKDGGRVMGLDRKTTERMSKLAPARATSVEDAVKANPELAAMGAADGRIQKVLDDTRGLEGTVNHTGSHPAGVVISSEPLDDVAPLQKGTTVRASGETVGSGLAITQYSMDPIAKLGLLKMDFLGLTNLTILDQAMRLAENGPADLDEIPLDDRAVFDLMGTGNTSMVFQLESNGMQRYIRELKPTSISDIAAMIALYRPGPMDNIDRFIQSKHGLERSTFPHPSMEDLLAETYGVIVYQDQVLQILQNFAGYTMGEADIVRKAMGKKIPKIMQDERSRFIGKAGEMGHDHATASEIFDIIEPFAGYAFNKAHSVSYGLITYWTAWYKAHHPAEYMTAALNCRLGDRDKYLAVLDECRRMGLKVEPPDVNRSEARSRPTGARTIRMGLTAVAGLGDEPGTAIAATRADGGNYGSITDFCRRGPKLHARTVGALIKSGALDDLGDRAMLVANTENIANMLNDSAEARGTGQLAMFDDDDDDWLERKTAGAADTEAMMTWEREALGTTVTWDPTALLSGLARETDLMRTADIEEFMEDHTRTDSPWIAGLVQDVKTQKARDQKEFTIITLALVDGSVDVRVWNDRLRRQIDGTPTHTPIRATGVLSEHEGGHRLNADRIINLRAPEELELVLRMRSSGRGQTDEARFRHLMNVLVAHPGRDDVVLEVGGAGDAPVATLDIAAVRVDAADERLRAIIGDMRGIEIAEG